MYGSWDPPGARLLDAVAVMDRLASPGGDPWKRAADPRSLAPFLLEESYEAYDAIVAGDLDALREELGDVLLQVVLHARLAEELPEGERWSVDDVAGGLVDKMVRRNPHVFAGAEAGAPGGDHRRTGSGSSRPRRPATSVLDGIALSQPALALAAKILERAAGPAWPSPCRPPTPSPTRSRASVPRCSPRWPRPAGPAWTRKPRSAAPPWPTPPPSAPPNPRPALPRQVDREACVGLTSSMTQTS